MKYTWILVDRRYAKCSLVLSGVALLVLAAGTFVAKALKAETPERSSLAQELRPMQGISPEETAVRVPEVPGPVTAILPEGGSSVYVGSRFGLYASRNDGARFQRILRTGIWGSSVKAVVLSPREPGVIYVGLSNRLFRWDPQKQRFRRILKVPLPILSLAVSPSNPDRILVATGQALRQSSGQALRQSSGQRIHWTEDRGATWHRTQSGLADQPIDAVAFHPILNGWAFCLAQGDLFLSRDGGIGWQRIWVTLNKQHREEETVKLPLESTESAEAVSAESAETEPPRLSSLAIDPTTGAIYLGTPQGVFVSSDGGTRFAPLASVGLGSPEAEQLLPDPDRPGWLYAATNQGLFHYIANTGHSANTGHMASAGQWTHLRQGLPAGPVHAVAVGNGGKFLWVGTDAGLFRIPMPVPTPGPAQTVLLPIPRSPGSDPIEGSMPSSSHEPTIQEIQQAAIRYAEVMPQKISHWRTLATLRNFLPRFTIGLDRERDRTIVSSTSKGQTTFSVGPEDESVSLDFGFTWDLGSLIWDSAQTAIDVRSRLMVQLRQDILEGVTRLYFERKRLQLEFAANPTEDPTLQAERKLRIEELTAQIDALTGGHFSRQLEDAAAEAK